MFAMMKDTVRFRINFFDFKLYIVKFFWELKKQLLPEERVIYGFYVYPFLLFYIGDGRISYGIISYHSADPTAQITH